MFKTADNQQEQQDFRNAQQSSKQKLFSVKVNKHLDKVINLLSICVLYLIK